MRSTSIMTNILVVVAMLTMTSCVKYYDLIKSEFPQGKELPDNKVVAAQYKRSAVVYDEFQTAAAFNVLWLSDELRSAYVNMYCDRRGLTCDEKEEMLKRQLEENKHWISFYVLADIRSKTNSALGDENASWTLSAQLGDYDALVPESIKEVDLEPEYQAVFGSAFNLFKVAYLVKFPIGVHDAHKLAQGSISLVSLIIKSVYKECRLVWDKDEMAQKRKIVRDEDFYWG